MLDYNFILLISTIIYGLAFGIKHWWLWLTSLFTNQYYSQSDWGRLCDAAFVVAIVYLFLSKN